MTVGEIVVKYLKDNGFDGLMQKEIPCGCELSNLAPCNDMPDDCEPAYRHECTGGKCGETCEGGPDSEFCMKLKKEGKKNGS